MPLVTVGEVALLLKVQPKLISDLFYQRRLDVDRCPIVSGRRLIPREYVDVIAIELRRAGKLPVEVRRVIC